MSNEVEKKNERELERHLPATDILERKDGWHMVLDMPGVEPDGLSIDLQDREIVVHGKSTYAPPAGEMHRTEFGAVEYARSFSLTDEVDRDKIKAVLKDGVLDLFLPRAEKTMPRKIEIKAG
ncbi:HSP20 family molecular chaperone IbpA [Desulfobaculum xiamenense]|uniref:HSP20 family molecular chaperone IbpA n=1 Tax=Desulfobaculum xiamenense TaxID=995050 RepID=A0A846QJN1_9BACT|nr:Hsp20/alpha crystallin family protein [Desulfobaculum xiamenense]NJB69086.1 HSP20 family molecular chaperone IbpA [Desulfobaculum xiamenense]